MGQKRIMLVDNEEGLCRMMEAVLADHGYSVRSYTYSPEAVADFQHGDWDLVVTDIKMPGLDGLEVLERIKAKSPGVPVIMITAFATVEMSIQALRKGAYDMLTKPFEPEELLYRVKNALKHTELEVENRELRKELAGRFRFEQIIGESDALQKVLRTAEKVAGRDISVLITGESGTGKELIAQAMHYHSPRKEKRFVAINCGALPENLLESELFGYRKGAFTGAAEDRQGLLEAADGGTLFLDEVGNLPTNVQKTLLRFLQEREFNRVGDTVPTQVDVRLISATNSNLENAVKEGSFREDLYYRLNVVNLHLPPLRQRREDIPLLVNHLVQKLNRKFGTRVQGLSSEGMSAACAFSWPGNVRQLQNVIEACLAVTPDDRIDLATLGRFIDVGETHQEQDIDSAPQGEFTTAMSHFEGQYLRDLLARTRGNVEAAALEAGMNIATIYRKMKKHRISREDFL